MREGLTEWLQKELDAALNEQINGALPANADLQINSQASSSVCISKWICKADG